MLSATTRMLLLALGAFAAVLPPVPAAAASPFPTLQGSWSGTGRVQFEGGQTESLRCNAYYTSSEGGTVLGLAIRCASAANKIEIRGRLTYSGGRVSGTWEERTFNASGTATGRANDNSVVLNLGGSVSGSMSVTVARTRQTVAISTQGTALRSVRIGLSRR
jgi:hypothetical protein